MQLPASKVATPAMITEMTKDGPASFLIAYEVTTYTPTPRDEPTPVTLIKNISLQYTIVLGVVFK